MTRLISPMWLAVLVAIRVAPCSMPPIRLGSRSRLIARSPRVACRLSSGAFVTPREIVLPARPVASVDDWLGAGGGLGLARARELGPDRTIEELERAGVRGHGGAGFPAATKWRTVRHSPGRHRYAVCNAAEGEPGTFKDRAILRANPYQVVEGLAIAAFVLDAREVFIALKAT